MQTTGIRMEQLPLRGVGPSMESSKDNFFEALKSGALGAVDAIKEGERASFEATSGDVDVIHTLTALTNAEHALETMMALRDRALGAYQEIARMSV